MKRWFLSDGIFIVIIYLCFSIFYVGCGKLSNDDDVKSIDMKLVYMRDSTTNLCFTAPAWGSSPTSFDTRALMCVPCDSLKNVTVYPIRK